jgi:hypothetical protein
MNYRKSEDFCVLCAEANSTRWIERPEGRLMWPPKPIVTCSEVLGGTKKQITLGFESVLCVGQTFEDEHDCIHADCFYGLSNGEPRMWQNRTIREIDPVTYWKGRIADACSAASLENETK